MVGPTGLTLIVDGTPLQTPGLTVSADVFGALGVQPALGRSYTAEEDFGGKSAVIIFATSSGSGGWRGAPTCWR